MVVPAVLVLVGRPMGGPANFQPLFDEARERARWLGALETAAAGGEISELHREDASCGIFVGKPMLVLLRPLGDPRYRPELTAPIDCAESLAPTSPLLGHRTTCPLRNKLHSSYNSQNEESRIPHNFLI